MRWLLLIIVLLNLQTKANEKPDSLFISYKKSTVKSEKAKYLTQLLEKDLNSDSVKFYYYLNELFKLSLKTDSTLLRAKGLQLEGKYLKKRGRLQESITRFEEAASIYKKQKEDLLLAGIYNNMGAAYVDKGDYKKSIEVLINALHIYDKLNDEMHQSKSLHNIGLIFFYQENYDLALRYYYQSLKIKEKLKDSLGLALTINNIGVINYKQKSFSLALFNLEKALFIYKKLNNKVEISMPLTNIADISFDQKNYTKALDYYHHSYSIDSAVNDKLSAAKTLIQLALAYTELNQFVLAKKYAIEALKTSLEVESKEEIKNSYESFAKLNLKSGNYKDACKYFELASQWKDTLYNIQNSKVVADLQTRYETEKKDLLLEKQKITIENQRLISIILVVGIITALILFIIIYIEYRQKKKAFIILEIQKNQITDSINYASRIQSALLPPVDLIKQIIPQHFILFQPKDIVSGDFYWIHALKDRILIAAADCTGHGVPGAFMSMLGTAYLNEIVNRHPESDAHEILNLLRIKVKTSLHQNQNSITKDGIDISLVIYYPALQKIQYAGANSPIVICRNRELNYLQPDKMPIGIYSSDDASFSLKTFRLQKEDIIYMFTDGYMDQFGGESTKKIGKMNFSNYLLEASWHTIDAQRDFLDNRLKDWRKDMEQMDDVLVMGIKI